MLDQDFEGLQDFSGHTALEDMQLAESILNRIDLGE